MDERIRRKERTAASEGGCLDLSVSLLLERIRSGYTKVSNVRRAAMFNNPCALAYLERRPATLEELLAYLPTQPKEFNMRVCLSICRNIYQFYHDFMIRGSSESSEERALDAVDDTYRHHIAYLIREPQQALTHLDNYITDTNHKSLLRVTCEDLRDITDVVEAIINQNAVTQQTLWDPSRAGLHALMSIRDAACACAARKKSGWAAEVSSCINNSVIATTSYVGCSEDVAFIRLAEIVNNDLFRHL